MTVDGNNARIDSGAELREYEELLLKRDRLIKEAGAYLTAYTRDFGDMVAANFELKIACIREKKTISYCRRRLNRGLAVDVEHMQGEIEAEMKLYRVELANMLKDNEEAKQAKTVDAFRASRSRKIYRRLAKLIHPDINPKTAESERLRELWERIVKAYRRSDADELDDLETLTRKELYELGMEEETPEIPDLEARIERTERAINDIISSEPYTYGEILADETLKESHRLRLQEEHADYERYLNELRETIRAMLSEGDYTLIRK